MLPLILLSHHATFTITWAIFSCVLEVSCEIPFFLFLNIDGSGILGTLATIEYRLPSEIANQLYSLIFFSLRVDGGGILGHEYWWGGIWGHGYISKWDCQWVPMYYSQGPAQGQGLRPHHEKKNPLRKKGPPWLLKAQNLMKLFFFFFKIVHLFIYLLIILMISQILIRLTN